MKETQPHLPKQLVQILTCLVDWQGNLQYASKQIRWSSKIKVSNNRFLVEAYPLLQFTFNPFHATCFYLYPLFDVFYPIFAHFQEVEEDTGDINRVKLKQP